jgi:hypothetical protein
VKLCWHLKLQEKPLSWKNLCPGKTCLAGQKPPEVKPHPSEPVPIASIPREPSECKSLARGTPLTTIGTDVCEPKIEGQCWNAGH